MTTSCARGGAAGPWPRLTLVLAVLGVVYGDIGTSPLYALRECFSGPHAVEPTAANVLGVLSLTAWSLILVVSVSSAQDGRGPSPLPAGFGRLVRKG